MLNVNVTIEGLSASNHSELTHSPSWPQNALHPSLTVHSSAPPFCPSFTLLSSPLLSSPLCCSVSPEACQTGWFDDGDVSAEGDSELVQDLRRSHRESICPQPAHMEVQTTTGIRAQHTKNSFHKYRPLHSLSTQNSAYSMLCASGCVDS